MRDPILPYAQDFPIHLPSRYLVELGLVPGQRMPYMHAFVSQTAPDVQAKYISEILSRTPPKISVAEGVPMTYINININIYIYI